MIRKLVCGWQPCLHHMDYFDVLDHPYSICFEQLLSSSSQSDASVGPIILVCSMLDTVPLFCDSRYNNSAGRKSERVDEMLVAQSTYKNRTHHLPRPCNENIPNLTLSVLVQVTKSKKSVGNHTYTQAYRSTLIYTHVLTQSHYTKR